ncbi:MAG: Asp-tRNA(Asn)/Glu-tRNA(Gln) amidotransferase GatCAB subunit B, partial [Chthoniobacterales bacterium]
IFVYAWLATPLLIACYLSRTGHYERAQIMWSAALAVFVAMIAAATGGITSFAAVWLVVIPVEAALAANPKAVDDLKGGKKKPEAVKGFLRGQVMKQTGGKADPALVGELLDAKLAELSG